MPGEPEKIPRVRVEPAEGRGQLPTQGRRHGNAGPFYFREREGGVPASGNRPSLLPVLLTLPLSSRHRQDGEFQAWGAAVGGGASVGLGLGSRH